MIDMEGVWNMVIGAMRSPASTVQEFELDPTDRRGLDEWLGHAEEAALVQCAPHEREEFREAIEAHHKAILDKLAAVEPPEEE